MLILGRKTGESFMIGDDIRVTVLSTCGGTVRVGIDAPRAIGVHRAEIYKRIKEGSHGHAKR